MKRVTRNEVSLWEIFTFAEKKYGKAWNACCDLFQGTDEILPFRGTVELYLSELKNDVETSFVKGDCKLAYEILIAFMEENKVEDIYFVGDGN